MMYECIVSISVIIPSDVVFDVVFIQINQAIFRFLGDTIHGLA